jgi:hypothetical protein
MTEATELYLTPRRIAEIAGRLRRDMTRSQRNDAVRRIRNALRRAGVLVERLGSLVVARTDLARVLPEVWERLQLDHSATYGKAGGCGRMRED